MQIINVTKEVIRDYLEESVNDETNDTHLPEPSLGRLNRITIQDSISQATFEPVTSLKDRVITEHSPTVPQLDTMNESPLMSTADMFLSPQYNDSIFEDGIFLPGTQFQELHTTLRNRIIDTARSTGPSRVASPDTGPPLTDEFNEAEDEESRRLAHLTARQEHILWQNYINEVSPWLDKFDNARHFELVLPIIAKHHAHLRYSILALSARQVELKSQNADKSCSLALYQHAIHLLSPLLQRRTTAVLASCVVLCVLEMASCSPKAWRRHLDGCAALIQALGISGGCGGLEQALFWCFARMDICGGLISSEKTLIPINKWMGAGDLLLDYSALQNCDGSFDMYANRIVYLTGQVVDLLCASGKWEQRHRGNIARPQMDSREYLRRWSTLFGVLERWYIDRSEEMKALLTISTPPGSSDRPFQTLFYGNGPATSGNQMYHTATLLMLKYKPSHIQFAKKPHSILWHARQICAISLSNGHHGCWTNSIQPLWIAGQHMSHPSEHQAILDIYERIERETGWATKWRADDLKEYWGECDN